ncbi:shieldin complex subunit 1 [Ctenodactylus gundi]
MALKEAQQAVRSGVFVYSKMSDFIDAYSSDQNTEHKDSWTPENFWFDPPMKSQSEAEEDDTLRKSLDRFYELLGHPQMASGDPLSASIGQCLSQKISELRSQESQEYALRTFQMARVILTRDGCSAVQSHSRDAGFCPLEEGGEALDDAERTPGLSKDVIRFLLQQNMRKDP